MYRILKYNLMIIAISVVIGFGMLVMVHLLPTEPMRQNVFWSQDMIEKEFTDELVIDGFIGTMTGNFTDCLMLEHAVYANPEHSVIEQALRMYRAESCEGLDDVDAWWPGHSLLDYLNGREQPREVEYSRYWHGYLVILKPLLLLFSFSTIRLINSTAQLFLLGAVLIVASKKRMDEVAYAMLLSVPFLYFSSSYASLSLSICIYIVLLASVLMLVFDQKLYGKKMYLQYFLLVGIVTSFFDFLTYPVVTLCIPLGLYVFMHGEDAVASIKEVFALVIQWAIGYAGMWASKWILSDALTGSNTIRDALLTTKIRSQSADGYSRVGGFFKVVVANIEPYLNWNYIFVIVISLVVMLWMVRGVGIQHLGKNMHRIVPFVLVACIPFGWWFVTQNHAEQHWCFTCRIIAGSVFAILLGVFAVMKNKDVIGKENRGN